ncbi:MAG TPA: SDR family oxidoreductase [Candidatus Binatia bacterium]
MGRQNGAFIQSGDQSGTKAHRHGRHRPACRFADRHLKNLLILGFQGVHYAASKAGIIQLTRVLAFELGLHQIRINAIAHGIIRHRSNVSHERRKHRSIVRSCHH